MADDVQPDMDAFPIHQHNESTSENASILLLSFKRRDEYPCGLFFCKAARLFHIERIDRQLWCDAADEESWATLHILRFVPRDDIDAAAERVARS